MLTTLALVALAVGSARAFTLEEVRADVKRDYPAVSHLGTDELARRLAASQDLLLLDVREADEFAVSRLDAARRVDPGTWRWSFLREFEDKVAGKTVVFYCSVGVRSSRLAEGVQSALRKAGAKAVFNLDGGIFAWHNERRPLTAAGGPTPFVHPFDSHWGKLLSRPELARTKPE